MEQLPFRPPSPRATALICGGLVLLFGLLSYWAALGKSATYDEPLHAVAGHLVRYHGDYRIDPEDGALFLRWGAFLHSQDELKLNLNDENFKSVTKEHGRQWPFVIRELFQNGSVDGDAYLNRSRIMFVPLGMALGALVAWWAWKLGGAIAAIAGAVLFCLDPNFLAHASLVKNDVALSLLMLWLMMAVWMFGQRATILRLLAIALACSCALNVKFSGLLFGPMVAIALAIRALLPQPWKFSRWELQSRWPRLGAAIGASLIIAILSCISIWAAYSFRFLPTKDPSIQFDMAGTVEMAKVQELRAMHPDVRPTEEEYKAHCPRTIVRAVEFASAHRLLPQTWLHGLLYTYATTLIRSSFIVGQYSLTGWWYFFPLTMLFKTPVTTMVVSAAALFGTILLLAKPRAEGPLRIEWWAVTCLVTPIGIYGGSAIVTNLNLGLRHILPVYPFLFVMVSVLLSLVMKALPKLGIGIGVVLGAGLLLETGLGATPNYLAFINFMSGGSRGGIKLVGDSSLDWGQDLKLLAEWQAKHPSEKLYLCYFGTADPAAYGVRASYAPHPTAWPPWGPWTQDMSRPGTLAMSATNLQSIYGPPELREKYKELFGHLTPKEVLGGTIYLYDWPLPAQPP